MLTTDQLKDLALFGAWQAMQFQVMAAQHQRQAEGLAQEVKRLTDAQSSAVGLTSKLPEPPPKSCLLSDAALQMQAARHQKVAHAGVDEGC